MAPRRCALCGEDKESGAGTSVFVCDACLGLKGRTVIEVMRGLVPGQDMSAFLSQQYRVPTINLREYRVPAEVFALLPRALCAERVVIAVARAGRSLIVAVADPGDGALLEALRAVTGLTIEPVIAPAAEIRAAIARSGAREGT